MRPARADRDPRKKRGRAVAHVLAGAWRPEPAPLVSEELLCEAAPRLLESGSAALAWWRLRASPLRSSPAGFDFQQSYRLNTLEAALQEREIGESVARLRSAGIEPLLGKGWAAARLYPAPGMRPRGDVDLYVTAEQYLIAADALRTEQGAEYRVDLHRGFADLDDRNPRDLHDRASRVRIDGTEVLVFSPEDHLRLLSLHLLRHGAWRSLWLCDVAAAVESLPTDFDWEYLGQGAPRRTQWVACVLALAGQLLEARTDGVPAAWKQDVPSWMVATVLREWGGPSLPHGRREPMATSLLRPADAVQGLLLRWPNPIEATTGLRASFNNFPRVPFQVAECLRRIAAFGWGGLQKRLARQA